MPYLTSATAAYPDSMNVWLADALVTAARDRKHVLAGKRMQATQNLVHQSSRTGRHGNTLVISNSCVPISERIGKADFAVAKRKKLTGGDDSTKESEKHKEFCLGGLRRPYKAVMSSSRTLSTGWRIREALFALFEASPNLVARCVEAIGSEEEDAGPTEQQLVLCRRAIASAVNCKSLGRVNNERACTRVHADLLGSWRKEAADPDDQPESG